MSWVAAAGLVIGVAQGARADRKEEEAHNQLAAEKEAAGEFQAVQLERKAQEERAIGTYEVGELAKEGRLLESKAQAIAAASGAGGYDFADIEAETEKNILMSLFNSELSARDLEVAAVVSRREGADAARAEMAAASATRDRTKARTTEAIGKIGVSLYNRYSTRSE